MASTRAQWKRRAVVLRSRSGTADSATQSAPGSRTPNATRSATDASEQRPAQLDARRSRAGKAQPQKYGPVPRTEAAPATGPRDKAQRQSARADSTSTQGLSAVDRRLIPCRAPRSLGHHVPRDVMTRIPHTRTQPDTHTVPRASRRSRLDTAQRVMQILIAARFPGSGGRGRQLGKLSERSSGPRRQRATASEGHGVRGHSRRPQRHWRHLSPQAHTRALPNATKKV